MGSECIGTCLIGRALIRSGSALTKDGYLQCWNAWAFSRCQFYVPAAVPFENCASRGVVM